MTVAIQELYLTRYNAKAKLSRFYRMQIVPGLFGDWGLIRAWGLVGSAEKSRTDWFDSEAAAKDARFDIHMKKAIRGYE